MLVHFLDFIHTKSGLPAEFFGNGFLKGVSPAKQKAVIVLRLYRLNAGFFVEQFSLGLVRINSEDSSGITAAYSRCSPSEPFFLCHFFRAAKNHRTIILR